MIKKQIFMVDLCDSFVYISTVYVDLQLPVRPGQPEHLIHTCSLSDIIMHRITEVVRWRGFGRLSTYLRSYLPFKPARNL